MQKWGGDNRNSTKKLFCTSPAIKVLGFLKTDIFDWLFCMFSGNSHSLSAQGDLHWSIIHMVVLLSTWIFGWVVPIGISRTNQYSEHFSIATWEMVDLWPTLWEFCWQGWCGAEAISGHIDLHYSWWYYYQCNSHHGMVFFGVQLWQVFY